MTEQSPEVGELFAALAKAQDGLRGAEKNSHNPHLKKSYANLQSVWNAWRKHGPANGLAVIQSPTADGMLRTVLGHSSGQWIASYTPVYEQDNKGLSKSQKYGAGLEFARRYSMLAIIGLYAGDDNDEITIEESQQEAAIDPMREKIKAMIDTAKAKKVNLKALKAGLDARYGYKTSYDITPEKYGEIMASLEDIARRGADHIAGQAKQESEQ